MTWLSLFSMMLFLFFFFWPALTNDNKVEAASSARQFFNWVKWLMLIPFLVGPYVFYALMRAYFSKRNAENSDAANAAILLTIETPKRSVSLLVGLFIILSLTIILTLLLFFPGTFLKQQQLENITTTERLIFGFFYVLSLLLLVVGSRRLFTHPYVFIATTKGFQYIPAGIPIGWILWEDVEEIRETSILSGNSLLGAITTIPVLGIKLRNPEDYARKYNPSLQKLFRLTGKFNNFQTEGVGDLLLNKADFGNHYNEVKTFIESSIQLKS